MKSKEATAVQHAAQQGGDGDQEAQRALGQHPTHLARLHAFKGARVQLDGAATASSLPSLSWPYSDGESGVESAGAGGRESVDTGEVSGGEESCGSGGSGGEGGMGAG